MNAPAGTAGALPGQSLDAAVEVDPSDLPAFCPNPKMPLWSSHPRVYLELTRTGRAMCPYCGTHYRLAGGPVSGH